MVQSKGVEDFVNELCGKKGKSKCMSAIYGHSEQDGKKSKNVEPHGYLNHKGYHQKYHKKMSENLSIELFDDKSKLKRKQGAKASNGEQIFKRIVTCLTKTESIKLFPYQLQLCEMCTVPALPGIYRDEYSKNKKKILANHGITLESMFNEVFFLSSRRMGKSLTMAFNANAYALSIPYDGTRPMIIAVFSVTRAAAEQFVKECQNALKCMPLVDEFNIEIKAQEIVFTNKQDPNDVRIIRSYCSRGNVSTNNTLHGEHVKKPSPLTPNNVDH